VPVEIRELHDAWTLTSTGGPVPAAIAGRTIPAQVPGSSHTDLLAAGLIPDPYLDRVEEELEAEGQLPHARSKSA